VVLRFVRGCIQKFPDWPPAARTANGTALITRCSCIAILWVTLMSFAAVTLCVASQRVVVVVVVVYSVIDLVRKLFDTPSYNETYRHSSVRIVTRGSVPCRDRDFYFRQLVHMGSGAHPASYPVGSFSEDKAVGV
jgi:hypothetical protein